MTEDWKRFHQENEALKTQMVAQKATIAALKVERDRDIRRASRVARCVSRHDTGKSLSP